MWWYGWFEAVIWLHAFHCNSSFLWPSLFYSCFMFSGDDDDRPWVTVGCDTLEVGGVLHLPVLPGVMTDDALLATMTGNIHFVAYLWWYSVEALCGVQATYSLSGSILWAYLPNLYHTHSHEMLRILIVPTCVLFPTWKNSFKCWQLTITTPLPSSLPRFHSPFLTTPSGFLQPSPSLFLGFPQQRQQPSPTCPWQQRLKPGSSSPMPPRHPNNSFLLSHHATVWNHATPSYNTKRHETSHWNTAAGWIGGGDGLAGGGRKRKGGGKGFRGRSRVWQWWVNCFCCLQAQDGTHTGRRKGTPLLRCLPFFSSFSAWQWGLLLLPLGGGGHVCFHVMPCGFHSKWEYVYYY